MSSQGSCFATGAHGERAPFAGMNLHKEPGMPRRKQWMMLCCTLMLHVPLAFAQGQEDAKQQSREIFKQLIEINTTDSVGNVTTAAEAIAKRLRDAGFPAEDVIVAGPNERKKNLVVRLHGTQQEKPILFLAHLDVVEALRKTGPRIHFNLSKRMAISTGAAPWTSKTGPPSW